MAGDTSPSLDPPAARRIAARLAELDVLWVEEPLAGTDLRGLSGLREAGLGIRIAGGEMTRTFAEGLAALDADAFDVYQPDVVLAAGMLRTRTIAEVALARNRWFTPHTWTNGLGLLANLHVAAGVGGGPFIEVPYDPPGWTPERRDAFLAEPIRPDADGVLRVPARPGLGAVIDEAAVARFAA
jgi:L-alanine-DL-glutamate epimerase-like enolase superfamily enzyme